MINKPIIGLVGKARSGKNHVGNIISLNYGYLIWAMANPLKMLFYGKFMDYPYEQIFGHEDKSKELRRELQLEGTERGRDLYGDQVWVRSTESYLRFCEDNFPHMFNGVVICDVRFPNEAEALRSWGAKILRIANDSAGLDGEAGQHRSESFIDSIVCDGVIDNNNRPSEVELLAQIDPFIKTEK